MKLKKIISGHLLLLVFVFPPTVSAEDFIFNVGVDLTNLHEDASKVQIVCVVGNSPSVFGDSTIGAANKYIDMPADGVLNTTVQLKFNANAGKNPADATNYRCTIQFLSSTNSLEVVSAANNPNCTNPDNDWKCAKPGAPFVGPHFNGTIP